jgi:hypothetical protein
VEEMSNLSEIRMTNDSSKQKLSSKTEKAINENQEPPTIQHLDNPVFSDSRGTCLLADVP